MNEEKSSVPFLTLDPNATAAAVQEAPAAEEAKEEVTDQAQMQYFTFLYETGKSG